MASSTIFEEDEAFWNNYLKGRPTAPEAFFDRIFRYHEEKGGRFGTVHDAGAGNGPYGRKLRSRFETVIISDIAETNVRLAQGRLGTDGFRYRVARIEDGADIPPGSVDLVFATNVLHFADQEKAVQAIAQQLRPGGTLVVGAFGSARFRDAEVQDVWARITHQAGRALLKHAQDAAQTQKVMERSSGYYNVAPLDERLFAPGARRIRLNMGNGGLTSLLPPEIEATEPSYTGPHDVEVWEAEEGWSIKTDLDGIKSHFASFPFSKLDPHSYEPLWEELRGLLSDGRVVEAYFPAAIILATRR
ncbi:S-adenosyl-L-methionine-dependent methyltransferase [Parathielavia appendiculata]|uniref:S-adenosyl-L-methionine-dependent methyltransferase n=1 Tax=Parathielavia appendiculata TaxID=2587402 RepID=A0AAN6TPY3_9PEZI|nr:S-adenosyl-L-methionine-dependent methyltransferase [Parathielavia appendiculata]